MDESKIYIDLDSIMDTRLGTIAGINAEAAAQLLKSEVYWFRETDHFDKLTAGIIEQEHYLKQYEQRDNDTLKRSYITGIFNPLLKLLTDNELLRDAGGLNKEISFEVNIWPYTFELAEIEAFIELFKYRLGMDVKVTLCSVPLANLTPTYLTDHYAGAFLYSFHEWIKLHLKELTECNHPDFTLVAPKLFEKDVSKLSIDDKRDELMVFRIYMLEHMDISFIDASCFSVFKPK